MGLFGRGRKKDNVVDLSERYKRQQEKLAEKSKEKVQAASESSGFGFLSNLASGSASISSENSEGNSLKSSDENIRERKRKLANKLMEITNRLEDLSNQIYHLQQRVDLLERKAGVKSSEIM